MKFMNQRWNRVEANLEIVAGGVGIPGLAPTCQILNLADGLWYQNPGWGAVPLVMPIPLVDLGVTVHAVLNGQYTFQVGVGDLTKTDDAPGYLVVINEPTIPITEFHRVTTFVRPDETLAEEVDLFTGGTTVGDALNLGRLATGYEAASTLPVLIHTADANDGTGQFFYAPNVPLAVNSMNVTNHYALFIDVAGNMQLVVVKSIQEAPPGDAAFELGTIPDLANLTTGIAIGDQLLVLSDVFTHPAEAWEAVMASHVAIGTTGDGLRRMLSLRQENLRVEYDAWNSGGVPTHGFVYIYDSKADLEADNTPWPLATGKYEIDATFDGTLRPLEYTSTREA
tara:strand:+ start:233 stop:1249 length:1017 start_codon:yes stop_codon:yes gene_type:complete